MTETDKFNNFFDKFIYIFLLLSPLLDALTSIFVRNINFPISIGTLIRGLLLLFVIIYLKKNYKHSKILLIFALYVLLAILYYFTISSNVLKESINIFHIFYLPILLLLFSTYNNEKIDDKLVVKIFLIYLNLIIIPYIFNIGYNLSESYSNKNGYFGLFIGGNEISAILVGLSAISLNYVNNLKNIILKIVIYIELLICIFLVGTKTLFIGIIIVLLYLFIKFIKNSMIFEVSSARKKMIIIPILFIVLLLVVLPKTPMLKNINTTLKYYNVNDIKDLVSIDNIDNVIFSKRLSNVTNISSEYSKSTFEGIIYGLGINKIASINVIEIDVFDIFFSIGIFGSFIYLLLILYTTKFNNLKNQYSFSLCMFILISLISGHVLTKPMVSIYISLLYILNRNSNKLEKKKILLVSNMYPSIKYKHYGTFVKNTEELLINNGFIVDKVVIKKQKEKIAKLFSYIYLHLRTIFKGIFNNYDFIYVHFISHSSLGAVFVKRTSKDVKLVLNAHGNDVVKDLDFEIKNEKRSNKYLKYADAVIVPSKYFKSVINKKYNVDNDKIHVYPSGGVNTNIFKLIDMNDAKKSIGLKKEYNYIGYVSRLDKNKGYDVFLKAIKELEKQNMIKNTKFLVIGAGNEEKEFNDLVRELNIKEYLEIRNMVSPSELVNVYNSLDIFVFPTYRESESLGLVGLEAMACERLVIASKNYGPTDYLIDNKNGKFFKPKDYKDLANKIIEMNNLNNEEKKKMKKKARETAIKYDSKNTVSMLLDVFK